MSSSQERTPRTKEDKFNLILAALSRLETSYQATHQAILRMNARMDAKGWNDPLQSGSYIPPLSSIQLPTSIPPIATNHAGMRGDIVVKGEESTVHEEVVREPEPSMDEEESSMEECKVESCEGPVAVEPRFKSLPFIKPSSLTSLATPWLDATPMVVSCFPFPLIDDKDMNLEVEDASLTKSSKGVLLEPNLPFFLHRYLCMRQNSVVPLKSCRLHLVCHDHVDRKFNLLHDVFSHKTRYSCIHQSSHSQFLSHDKGNIICMTFVVQNMTCISCSILKHIFKLRLGNTFSWRFMHGYALKLLILEINSNLTSFSDVGTFEGQSYQWIQVDVRADSRTNLFQGREDDVNRNPRQESPRFKPKAKSPLCGTKPIGQTQAATSQ